MSTRRKPIKLAGNGITQLIAHTNPERIDLGIAQLKIDMRDGGWTARTPDDDRRDRVRKPGDDQDNSMTIDYSDPTGELAIANDRMHDDHDEIQDLQLKLEHILKRLTALAGRYVPTAAGDPVCTKNDCDDTVERTSNGKGFRDCVLIAGIWCQLANTKPRCMRHRKDDDRRAKAEEQAREAVLDEQARLAS